MPAALYEPNYFTLGTSLSTYQGEDTLLLYHSLAASSLNCKACRRAQRELAVAAAAVGRGLGTAWVGREDAGKSQKPIKRQADYKCLRYDRRVTPDHES